MDTGRLLHTITKDTGKKADILLQARRLPLGGGAIDVGGVGEDDAIFANAAVHVDDVANGRGHCGCIRRPVSRLGRLCHGKAIEVRQSRR